MITQPSENKPVSEFVQDKGADHTAVNGQFRDDSRAPVLKRRRCSATWRSQMHIEEIRIEIATAHVDRVARSSAESEYWGHLPATTSFSSSARALPPDPAVFCQASTGSGSTRHNAPGPTLSTLASWAIVSRSTRDARPARMFRTVFWSSPAASANWRAFKPRCVASSSTRQVIVAIGISYHNGKMLRSTTPIRADPIPGKIARTGER